MLEHLAIVELGRSVCEGGEDADVPAHGASWGPTLGSGGAFPGRARIVLTTSHMTAKRKTPRLWSKQVTETSNALDLEPDVFKLDDPAKIAASLKRSAERSRRRKSDPFRSAMSMLVFYVNRAGKNLPASRKRVLEQAKGELRRLFGREP